DRKSYRRGNARDFLRFGLGDLVRGARREPRPSAQPGAQSGAGSGLQPAVAGRGRQRGRLNPARSDVVVRGTGGAVTGRMKKWVLAHAIVLAACTRPVPGGEPAPDGGIAAHQVAPIDASIDRDVDAGDAGGDAGPGDAGTGAT